MPPIAAPPLITTQLEALVEAGATYAQGYLFGRARELDGVDVSADEEAV